MTIRDELEQILRKQDVYAKMPRAELLKIIDARIADAAAVTNAAQFELDYVIETEGGPDEYDTPEEPTAVEPEAVTTKEPEVPQEPADAPEEAKVVIDLSDGVSPEELAAVVEAVKTDAREPQKAENHEKKSVGPKKSKSKD